MKKNVRNQSRQIEIISPLTALTPAMHSAGYSTSVGLTSLRFSGPPLYISRGCVNNTQMEYIATEKKWMKSKTGSDAILDYDIT
jgi:hypothetical protein